MTAREQKRILKKTRRIGKRLMRQLDADAKVITEESRK